MQKFTGADPGIRKKKKKKKEKKKKRGGGGGGRECYCKIVGRALRTQDIHIKKNLNLTKNREGGCVRHLHRRLVHSI